MLGDITTYIVAIHNYLAPLWLCDVMLHVGLWTTKQELTSSLLKLRKLGKSTCGYLIGETTSSALSGLHGDKSIHVVHA